MKSYKYLALDVLNIAYRLFNSIPKNQQVLLRISNKIIYGRFVKEFIELISYWKSRYLEKDGEIYLLFDNPTSRDDLKQLFYPLPETASRKEKFPEYKANRKAASKEFYSSVDFIRWYYMMGDSDVNSCRITHIEADDLVKPLIRYLRKKDLGKILLVTNDSDWCRFIEEGIDYLPELYEEPQTYKDFQLRKGYFPTEDKIILDKIIYGDAADNIYSAFPDLSKEKKDFLLSKFESIQDLYQNYSKIEDKELVSYCRDHIRTAQTVYQMVSLIPVSDNHFEAIIVSGRKAMAYKQTIDKALKISEEKKDEFQFGFLKYPRVDPKES